MLDTPWVLATHSVRQFPVHFPSRASPCTITFKLESTSYIFRPPVLSTWPPSLNVTVVDYEVHLKFLCTLCAVAWSVIFCRPLLLTGRHHWFVSCRKIHFKFVIIFYCSNLFWCYHLLWTTSTSFEQIRVQNIGSIYKTIKLSFACFEQIVVPSTNFMHNFLY